MTDDASLSVREQAERFLKKPVLAAAAFSPISSWQYSTIGLIIGLVNLARGQRGVGRLPSPLYLVVTKSEVVAFGFKFGVTTTLTDPAATWPGAAVTGIGATDDHGFEMSGQLGSRCLNLRGGHGDEGARAVYAALRGAS